MLTKLQKTWTELDQSITVNKRELVLGVTACTLAGILVGILLSPKKTTTIGSHNGNNNVGNSASAEASGKAETPDEAQET
ncbi:MAG: hypothetical protein ACI3V5_07015 [Faecousia sp.]